MFSPSGGVYVAGLLLLSVQDSPSPEGIPLFISGQEGYHTYRIPALTVTRSGTVLAFCEGRRRGRGDSGDIDLLVRLGEDDRVQAGG